MTKGKGFSIFGGKDKIIWKIDMQGQFSVSSPYATAFASQNMNPDEINLHWKCFWKNQSVNENAELCMEMLA